MVVSPPTEETNTTEQSGSMYVAMHCTLAYSHSEFSGASVVSFYS